MHVGEICDDRFELLELAGVGGMGSVYRGVDRLSGEDVAIKIVEVAGVNLDRFAREIEMLSTISKFHPAIVRYVSHGMASGGAPFLAMEWLEGEDLSKRLKREGVSLSQCLSLGRRVTAAIAAAHRRGVIHRDIKPSNLFLVDGDPARVKILDFGLARPLTSSRQLTRTGAVLGTAGYMSPEQIVGDREIDARTDVFSTGCVLFECLTGTPAFPGDRLMAVLAKVVLEDSPRLRDARPELSCELEAAVARMMAKNREDRYLDGGALLEAIEQLGEQSLESAPLTHHVESTLTGGEQRLLSVIALADYDEASSLVEVEGDPEVQPRSLDEIVAPWDGEVLRLGVGTLLVVLRGRANAVDLAHRAARCALAVRDGLPDAHGVLVTGFAEMSGRGPVGPAVERAAKLLEVILQEPGGQIYVDEVSAGLLETRFDLGAEGVLRRLGAEHFLGVGSRRLLGKPTPCVGRNKELSFLEACYDECLDEGLAQPLVVLGEAGVGKSRLKQEFLELLQRRPSYPTVLFARGDLVSTRSAFALAAQLVRSAAGFPEGAGVVEQHELLREHLACGLVEPELTRVAEFLGEMTHAPSPHEHSAQLRAALNDARLLKEQLRGAFVDWVGSLGRRGPLVLVLEDLQWGDGPSVSYIERALTSHEDLPMLVMAFARPVVAETFPDLWETVGCQQLSLRPLRARACEQLVRSVLDAPSNVTVERIVSHSGGNAFYLEELVRHVANEASGQDLPESVLAMVQSRLEGLDADARRVLRAGSVFGRVFWDGAAGKLLGDLLSEEDRRGWLDMLVDREVLIEEPPDELGRTGRFRGERELVFRHDIVRDAAYSMLTGSDRTLGHRLAGEWLDEHGETDAMVLAEHYVQGAVPKRAEEHFINAARGSLTGGYLEQALTITKRGVEGGATGGALGALSLIQAQVHTWREDYEDAGRAATEALALTEPGTPPWLHALGMLGYSGAFGGDPDAIERAAEHFRGFQGDLLPIGPAGRASFTLLASMLATGQTCFVSAWRVLRASILVVISPLRVGSA